ncbi:helix-turn-helix domain-containing protein (plasmid) [Paraclostridium sordellii]|uniref:helix-turn-helix domain-containing protein n=1 Tax=Paraclostridium sordellii TaxID=1505 RepID=UPI0030CC015C
MSREIRLRNKDKALLMRNRYKFWKYDALDKSAYFIIFQGFLEDDKLKDISGNALKLYIYLGINSNNYEGVVWHSNKKISEYFGKSERTIRTWMKELEEMKLIKRMRLEYDGITYTYLQPYEHGYKKKSKIGVLYFNSSGILVFQEEYGKSKNIYNKITSISIFRENYGWIKGILKIKNFSEDFFSLLAEGFIDIDDGPFNIEYMFESEDGEFTLDFNMKKDVLVNAILYSF